MASEATLLKVVRLSCSLVTPKNDPSLPTLTMKEIVFGYEYWFRTTLYNRKNSFEWSKLDKFFPTTDKSLVIACVLNDKVSKTVYS